MSKNVYILGIESSCDETAAAVVKNGREVLSNIIASQVVIHRKFGGVVPEIASRKHIENILPVIDEALRQAGVSMAEIDAVAVTYGPGLVGALLVGLSAAKALAWANDKPLIGVNHLEGHVFANFLNDKDLEPPFMALVVSGGHTALLKVVDYNNFELLGQTRDDAAGEAFDKIARVMGLQYPGGPEIEKLAAEGNPRAIDFPRALLKEEYQFSFSGLKSAVINYLHNEQQAGREVDKADVEQNKVMAILAYFGILVLIPILAAKDSKFARFHANQGLLLCIAMFGWIIADSVLTALLRAILWRGLGLWSIYSLCGTVLNLVYIVFTVLAVIGIINALNGRAKELPIIGKYRLLK